MLRVRRVAFVALVAAVAATAATACSADERTGDGTAAVPAGGEPIVVVTTFPLLTELVERIGGDRVQAVNLIPLGVDEHAYHPPTTVARDIARANLALVNGYHLEEGLLSVLVENVRAGVPVVSASAGLTPVEGTHVHEFIEGDLDRAAVDAAVAEMGDLVEAGLRGDLSAVQAVDEIDVIVHSLPSRSRTDAVRAIDRFVHDVPRGRITAEEALAGIAEITRAYEPAPGPDAVLAQVETIVQRVEDGRLEAEAALTQVDRLLDGISLDDRDARVLEVDIAVQEWRDGSLEAVAAVARLEDVLHGAIVRPEAAEGAQVDEFVFAEGDPHFWLDARNMAVYAENIRDALIRVDPEGAEEYRVRTAEVVAELEALHEELLTALAIIPVERRKLIVFHDAFRYFAAAYEFETIASVAPANPNQATSAAAIARIIATVRDSGVPTIYREPQYSSQSLDLIAQDSGTTVGILHSIPTEQAPTYAEMMRANARALLDGLGGG